MVESFDHPARGWNVARVAAAYRQKWEAFVAHVEQGEVLGVPPDGTDMTCFDLAFHNTTMCFAHALGSVATKSSAISFLDWGCALGHYRVLANRLYPELQLAYTGRDLPPMVAQARGLHVGVVFCDNDTCLNRSYDFVMASTSLHYSNNWEELVARLGGVSRGKLYLTGVPVVHSAESFLFMQRAHSFGYDTEYVGWCLNRHRLLAAVARIGGVLEFEYNLGYAPRIKGAPEQCQYRGFLFRMSTYR